MTMTKEEAAAALDRNEYREEGSREVFAAMKAARLVAVFGASDDLTMFAGAVDDGQGLGDFYFDTSGLLLSECEEGDDCPYFQKLTDRAAKIATDFSGTSGFLVSTSIPHAPFKIMEDGEQYGEGLVFSLDQLGADHDR